MTRSRINEGARKSPYRDFANGFSRSNRTPSIITRIINLNKEETPLKKKHFNILTNLFGEEVISI